MSGLTLIKPTEAVAAAKTAPPRGRAPWRLAILLAVAAAACGTLLTGVSVWFLGAVALAGLGPAAFSFNFHTPAAFVRLFALGKTACKYGERVVGHRAALLDQVMRRTGLFAAMAQAPGTRTIGWQLGNQDRLADYLDDVEDVDYARLRVGMPAIVLMIGLAVLAACTAWLVPLALLPIGTMIAVAAAMLYLSFPRVTEQCGAMRASERRAGQLLGAGLAAVVPLKAERAFVRLLAATFAHFNKVVVEQTAQRRRFAVLDTVIGLVGPAATLSVLVAAWQAGDRNDALLVPAFLAFSWLAFAESATGVSRMVLARVREKAAQIALQSWQTGAGSGVAEAPLADAAPLRHLVLNNVPRQSPDGRCLGAALNVSFNAGQPVALVGASGTGKTTLLKQIAGWIGGDSDGRFVGDDVVLLTARRRAMAYLCLHDAAILADTIRENLFAPAATEHECWAALAAVELDGRVAAAGGLKAWISQDMLSLGEAQRLNLARAILSPAPLVLLDEPVEHLDSEQAPRILSRVLAMLADRIVVYSSHSEDDILRGCHVTL